MIQIDAVRLWGISDFTVTEGYITQGSAECVWCNKVARVGEFVMVVKEDGRAPASLMHPKCLPTEVKAARSFAIGLAQDQWLKSPQRAHSLRSV